MRKYFAAVVVTWPLYTPVSYSGIPESVEIPAPVRTVTFRTPRAHNGAALATAAFSGDGSTCPTLRSSVSGAPRANPGSPWYRFGYESDWVLSSAPAWP